MTTHQRQSHILILIGYLLAMAATFIWAGNFIIARELRDSIPPISLAFWRWTIATIVWLPFAITSLIREWAIARQHWRYLMVTAFLGIALFNTFIYIAGQTTTAINMSLIAIAFPIFVMLISAVLFKQALTLRNLLGIILVISGMLLLLSHANLTILLNINFVTGDLWMLLAAFFFAVYSILLKKRPPKLSLFSLQLSTFALGSVMLLPAYLIEYHLSPAPVITTKTVLLLAYTGVFASLVAFSLWSQSITLIGPSRSSLMYYTLPIFSSVLAYVFLGENLTMLHLYSALLIISGIIVASYSAKSPQQKRR